MPAQPLLQGRIKAKPDPPNFAMHPSEYAFGYSDLLATRHLHARGFAIRSWSRPRSGDQEPGSSGRSRFVSGSRARSSSSSQSSA